MQSIEVELEGQKQDERGRQIRSPEEWAKLIELYHQSGLTQKAFAKHEGLKYPTFVAWLGRRRREGLRAGSPRASFATLRLDAPPVARAPLEVVLSDGTRLRGDEPAKVAALVKALRD